jgi:hypothetical protein
MGIGYYFHHVGSRTYISLGKRLSSKPRFEGHGMEIPVFIATRRMGGEGVGNGEYIMSHDLMDRQPHDDGGWTNVTEEVSEMIKRADLGN